MVMLYHSYIISTGASITVKLHQTQVSGIHGIGGGSTMCKRRLTRNVKLGIREYTKTQTS
jgi:hypothetical protein